MLSPKQEKFCLQYASSGNVSASYMMAGYRVRDMNTASAAATRLLKRPQIQGRLRELAQEVRDDRIADIKECQEILTRIARNEDADDSNRIKAVQLLFAIAVESAGSVHDEYQCECDSACSDKRR